MASAQIDSLLLTLAGVTHRLVSGTYVWIVSQIGAREHYAVPRGLARRGSLDTLFTDLWAGKAHRLLQNGPPSVRALAGRYHPELSGQRVVGFNWRGIWNALQFGIGRRMGASYSSFDVYVTVGERFARAVRRSLERRKGLPGRLAYFGYNTGCLETLEWLNERGIPSVVAQIDPGRVEAELVIDEVARWPGWAVDQPVIHDGYYARLSAEWGAATRVLVNSDWSREALVRQGVPDEKIVTVPLAYEPAFSTPVDSRPKDGPLRVLWLGQVVLRKGIQYLVEAAKRLPERDFVFTVAGPIGISESVVSSVPPNLTFTGRITRDRVSDLYREADIFVLPTLSDGFAITQLEAMAHGVPVIATPNCGRVVTDGEDGLIVPPRDPDKLADALAWCLENRRRLDEMRQNALRKSRTFTLEAYVDRLEACLRQN